MHRTDAEDTFTKVNNSPEVDVTEEALSKMRY